MVGAGEQDNRISGCSTSGEQDIRDRRLRRVPFDKLTARACRGQSSRAVNLKGGG